MPWHKRFVSWTWGLIRQNPWKAGIGIVTFFSLIVPAVAGYNIVAAWVEPGIPTWRSWVRGAIHDVVAEVTDPLLLKIQTHDAGLDYLILKDQRQALKDAQAELAKHPDSDTAKQVIDSLQKSIKWRSDKLDKETNNEWQPNK